MAGAALAVGVPIIIDALKGPVGELLAKLVPGIFSFLQKKHGPTTPNNPDVGKMKFETAYSLVLVLLQNMAAAGDIPKELPNDARIKEQVQKLYDWAVANNMVEGKAQKSITVGTVLVLEVKAIQ